VLRVPGTTNSKYKPAREVSVVGGDWAEWDIDDFTALILAQPMPEPPKPAPSLAGTQPRGFTGLTRAVAGMQQGNRNNVLYWAARRAREEQRPVDAALRELLPAAIHAGLDEAEATRTIRSAFGKAGAR
jgi:hypothetical protein